MDTLLLITCCKLKQHGGDVEFHPSSFLREHLSSQTFSRLMKLRSDLAELMGFREGPDVGGRLIDTSIRYMPAYERYRGRMYTSSQFHIIYPHRNQGVDLLIISALYGLVHPDDLIRRYELNMACIVPYLGKVGKWWAKQGLREIVLEAVENLGVQVCHDLLSKGYRSVFTPWPPRSLQGVITVHEFPGQGIGSMYRRAEMINHLLIGKDQ